MKWINNWHTNNPGVAWLIVLIVAIISVSGIYYFNTQDQETNDNTGSHDIVSGKWHLVRNDSNIDAAGITQRTQTIWSGSYTSKDGSIAGVLTEQTTTDSGKTETQEIEGLVSGILRAELLSLSYGSKDVEGAGSGAWLLKRKRDGNKTFVGQAVGYDCEEGKVTRCPALLTQNTEFAIVKYKNDLSQLCVVVPLSEEQVDTAGTNNESTCPN